MPTLFRFLGFLVVLGALGLGAMVALATLVQPDEREMTVPIPPSRFVK